MSRCLKTPLWARVGGALIVALVLAVLPPAGSGSAASSPNTWSTIASLPAGRDYLGAASSATDNRIYAYDGQTSSGASGANTAFTPGGSSWATAGSDPSSAYAVAGTATSDGKLWTFTGSKSTGLTNAAQYYTTSTSSWTSVANVPTQRSSAGAAVGNDGRIYLIGGVSGSSYLKTVEAFDTGAGVWYCSTSVTGCTSTSSPPVAMPTARSNFGIVAGSNGLIYVIGGQTGSSTYTSVVEAYNASTRAWTCSVGDTASGCASTTLAPMPTARVTEAALGSNGIIYVVGGYNGGYLGTVEAYNPTSNTWECSSGDTATGCTATPLTAMPTARAYLGLATGSDGNIYAIGGYNGSYLTTVQAYMPLTLPGAPTGVTATAGDTTASVSWSAPASTGGSSITGYTVSCSPSCTSATVGGSTTNATVTGLTDGTSYTFTVTATTFVGTGSASTASNAVTPSCSGTNTLNVSGAAPGSANVSLDGADSTVYTTLGSYTASSTKCTGWYVTMQASQFVSPHGDTFPSSSLLMAPPMVSSCTSGCGNSAAASPPSICIHSSSVALDSGSPVTVASAAAGTGQGTYTFTPGTLGSGNLQLTVPSYAYAATYSSTLTVSIVQGPAAGC